MFTLNILLILHHSFGFISLDATWHCALSLFSVSLRSMLNPDDGFVNVVSRVHDIIINTFIIDMFPFNWYKDNLHSRLDLVSHKNPKLV